VTEVGLSRNLMVTVSGEVGLSMYLMEMALENKCGEESTKTD